LILFHSRPFLFGASPFWGNLKPGEYPVGFTVRLEYDESRTFLPKWTYDGKKTQGVRARPIQIAIWYPAATSSKPPMLFEEYVSLIAQELNFGPLTRESKEQSRRTFVRDLMALDRANESAANALLELPTAAVRDAAARKGAYPLILFAPGSSMTAFSDSPLCEYLASHGYIVAAMPSMGAYARDATVDQVGFYAYMQDIEFVSGYMRHFPNVDSDRLGIVGFSMGGSAASLVQMRNTDFDAAVYLDTGAIFTIVDGWFRPIPFYNRADLRIPQLYLTRRDAEFLDPAAIDTMPYAERLLVLFAKGYRHTDFISFGMFPSLVPNYDAEPRATKPQAIFETVAQYTLRFLDAYVRKESGAQGFLLRRPEDNGVPAGLISVERKMARKAPPREPEFLNLLRTDPQKARAIFDAMKQEDPELPIFREASLNALAYEFLARRMPDRAIDAFTLNTEAYPQSANAFDSLSEAYEAAGKKDLAIKNARTALSLLDADKSLDDRRREAVRRASEERLKRLN
ncbi:MAG TPA: hypothetical protein VLR94_07340, partial [Acidobacteriota bacterium]|nr:hypothetical protein [Acidobacteriota bacterium]